jgi:hypothetical protein
VPMRAPGHRPRPTALLVIRALHSAVFLAELWAIGWLVATGLVGRRDRSVVVAAALVAAESVVFMTNRGTCPLTPLAERYGAEDGRVSDMFLPDALARTIPCWSIPLVGIGVALHVRAWGRRRQRRMLGLSDPFARPRLA